MKLKLLKSIFFICMVVVLNCNQKLVSAEANSNIKTEIANEEYIKFDGEASVLDVQYSNIIYHTDSGVEIIRPVFGGTKGNIQHEDLRQYCLRMGKLESIEKSIRPIQVLCKKGEVKKTFYEFLAFYKTNLLKDVDIEHPTEFGMENKTWIIRYKFKVNGVPGSMMIQIDGSEKNSPQYKSVYEIQIDEDGGWFIYDIGFRTKTPK